MKDKMWKASNLCTSKARTPLSLVYASKAQKNQTPSPHLLSEFLHAPSCCCVTSTFLVSFFYRPPNNKILTSRASISHLLGLCSLRRALLQIGVHLTYYLFLRIVACTGGTNNTHTRDHYTNFPTSCLSARIYHLTNQSPASSTIARKL